MSSLSFTLTPDAYIQVRRSQNVAHAWRDFFILGILGLLIGIAFAASKSNSVDEFEFGIVVRATMIAIAVETSRQILAYFVFTPWSARVRFKQDKFLQQPFNVNWDSESIEFITPSSKIRTLLSDFVSYENVRGNILLYRSSTIYTFIPDIAFENAAKRLDLLDKLKSAGVKYRWP